MESFNFILVLRDAVDDATADELFEAGLDDAAVTEFAGSAALDVDREAISLLAAISTAVEQAESVSGVEVLRVDGEELVSQSEIAARSGRSRQAVNHWIRRDGVRSRFPSPAYGAGTRSPLWRWAEVEAWLDPDGPGGGDRSRVIALANAGLEARRRAVGREERRLVKRLIGSR